MKLLAMMVLAGCGGGSSTVRTSVHVLRGAAGVSTAPFAPATGDGLWFLSPDKAKVTIDSIDFIDATGTEGNTAKLTDCTPTYDRKALGLTPLLDCPIEAPVGSWSGVSININPTAAVLIDDAAHGLFTTASGLSTTMPATVDFASVTVPNNGGDFPIRVYLDTPLVIASGDADAATANASLSIIVDMNHTLFANVSGASATFNTSLPIPPVSVAASTSGSGKATFYSATGTAANYNAGLATGDDTGSARFYYPTPTGQPGFLFFVTPGPGEAYPLDAKKAPVGGYLGRDPAGMLCWANSSQDTNWSHYSQYCAMHEVATIGDTTTLVCKHADPAPSPTSGDTYASGCPPITAPDSTEQLTLVAQ